MKLHVVIEKGEAGYFVAEVPALAGCLCQGKTQKEALKKIKEEVEGWLGQEGCVRLELLSIFVFLPLPA